MALARAVLGIKVFSKQGVFPGETPRDSRGRRAAGEPLPKMMLGPGTRLPRTNIFDCALGFFHRRRWWWEGGTTTGDYESACPECGFKPMGRYEFEEGPRAQPHEIGDVLHHEPVSSWLRREEEKPSLRTMAGDAGGAGTSHARSCPAHQYRI